MRKRLHPGYIKKGQLLLVRDGYVWLRSRDKNNTPGRSSIHLKKGDTVMYLSNCPTDWCMTGGPRGAMSHRRQMYNMEVLYKEHVWNFHYSIVEDSYNELDMKFLIYPTDINNCP